MLVLIDPEALEAYRISSEALADTLRRNNRLIPAGALETGGGRFAVKVPQWLRPLPMPRIYRCR